MNLPLTSKSLVSFLNKVTSDLSKGEFVNIQMSDSAHKKYMEMQMQGLYRDILCVKNGSTYAIGRVK